MRISLASCEFNIARSVAKMFMPSGITVGKESMQCLVDQEDMTLQLPKLWTSKSIVDLFLSQCHKT
jgi:hypothetical protein